MQVSEVGKPLFIPLTGKWFDQFAWGNKDIEYTNMVPDGMSAPANQGAWLFSLAVTESTPVSRA